MAVKEPTGDLKKACWKGYTAVGMKMKNGRKVPNCVPVKEESNEPKDREWGTTKLTKRYKKDTPGQCDCNTMKEEAEKQTHLVKVTVSEPSLKSAEPMLKGVRVRATSEGEAIKRAKSHFRKAGYKVHDAYHHSTITTVKKAGQMDEAATSKNPHYGYHGTQEKDADKKYSAMHTRVKKVVGAAGHLGDVKKPNVVVRHYLDSVRGRHADGRSDGYIVRDFAKFKKTYKPEMHEEAGQMDEGADIEYHVVIRHPQEGKRSVRVSALTPTEAKEKAQRDYPDHKVDKVRDPQEKHYFRGQDLDEGMTKAINKKMKNTLSAMRGRESLGAPEKGLSWQQNKAKAVKAGRAMAKEEFKAGDKVHLGLTTKGGSGMKGTLRKIEGGTAHIEVDDPTSKYGPRIVKGKVSNLSIREEIEQIDELSKETLKSYIQKVAADSQKHPQNPSKRPPEKASRSVAGFDKAYQKLAREEVEQISEGPQRDATRAKNKLKDAIAGANYKRTGVPVPDAEPQHKTAQAHNKAIGRSLRKMEEGTRDLTAALAKKIEKKTGGKETAVRNKAGLLVTKKKSKDKFEEAFKLSPKNSLKYREHKHEYEREEQIKNRPSYQGYHTQIHVDGRHYKAGDRMGAGEKGAQDAARHAANIAKKTGKKVSLHMIHHETGKTLAVADHEDGKWKYRNLSEAAPIQKQPKAGVEKLVSKMNPDTKAKTVSETRNIIREVIKKAVDKQETNKANGKTATGEAMPKIQIDPTIDLGARNV